MQLLVFGVVCCQLSCRLECWTLTFVMQNPDFAKFPEQILCLSEQIKFTNNAEQAILKSAKENSSECLCHNYLCVLRSPVCCASVILSEFFGQFCCVCSCSSGRPAERAEPALAGPHWCRRRYVMLLLVSSCVVFRTLFGCCSVVAPT